MNLLTFDQNIVSFLVPFFYVFLFIIIIFFFLIRLRHSSLYCYSLFIWPIIYIMNHSSLHAVVSFINDNRAISSVRTNFADLKSFFKSVYPFCKNRRFLFFFFCLRFLSGKLLKQWVINFLRFWESEWLHWNATAFLSYCATKTELMKYW